MEGSPGGVASLRTKPKAHSVRRLVRSDARKRDPEEDPAGYASSSTQLISLRSFLPVVSSRWFSSAFLYSLYLGRPALYSAIQALAKVPSWISPRIFFI